MRCEGRKTGIKNCFTLVEMLVVITIISILASLLLPAMDKGLQAARKSACLNQMRQAGVEFVTYSESNNGHIPLYYSWNDKQRTNLVWDVNGTGSPSTAGFTGLGKLYYAGLMRMGQIYFCPSEREILYDNRNSAVGAYNQWPPGRWGTSSCPPSGASWSNTATRIAYGMRPAAACGSGFSNWQMNDPAAPTRISRFISKMIMSELPSCYRNSRRHITGVNALRADGSGRWVEMSVFYDNVLAACGLETNTTTLNSSKLLSTDASGNDTGVWADLDKAR